MEAISAMKGKRSTLSFETVIDMKLRHGGNTDSLLPKITLTFERSHKLSDERFLASLFALDHADK